MRLQSIKYSQFDGQPNEWNLDLLDFLPLNLIVGKNASGKTRTITLIYYLAGILSGDLIPAFPSLNFRADFTDQEKNYQYILKVKDRAVIDEQFIVAGKTRLKRNPGGTGEIWAEQVGKDMEFQVDEFASAFASRRDNIQHPFFEPLYQWAKSVYYYRFGTDLGRNTRVYLPREEEKRESMHIDLNMKDDQFVVSIFKTAEEKFGEHFKKMILDDMSQINYNVIDVGLTNSAYMDFGRKHMYLWIQEKDLESKTNQWQISQGMFRALSLIIQLNYLKMTHIPSCILIDDIGEGLDYERSCALIKLIMEKAENSQFQLIMATNDRFVMNEVPLEYWTVLHREGKRCRVFNSKNSKEKFEKFRFTGLNNFDFFSSDYLIEQ
jgi:AAA15 family ATPase/GTPase